MRFRRNDKVRLLEGVALFEGCSADELDRVARLAEEHRYDDGGTVVREGTAGHEFVVLVEGDADVQVGGRSVASVGPGDFFGEISLVGQTRRTASVVAKGPVRALAFDEDAFTRMLAEVPALRARVSRSAFDRLLPHAPDQPGD